MSKSVTDSVQRYASNGTKVIVIGAGTSGMQTALECWRKGCEVEVIDKGDGISPLGKARPSLLGDCTQLTMLQATTSLSYRQLSRH